MTGPSVAPASGVGGADGRGVDAGGAGQLRALVAGLNAVVWERDPDTSQVRLVNERVVEVLGHPVAAWLDDPGLWERTIHPDDRDVALATVRRVVADGGADFSLDYRALRADGAVVELRHLGHVARDAEGRATAVHAVLIDVTQERRRERAAALLAEASRVLTSAGSVEERLAAVAGLAVGHLGDRATVWLRGDDGRYRPVAVAPAESAAPTLALAPVAAPAVLEEAYRAGAPFVVGQIDEELRRAAASGEEHYEAIAALPTGRVLVAPLVAGGLVVGLLTLVAGSGGPPLDDADVDLAGELGQRIATMVAAERIAARQEQALRISVALSAAGTVAEAAAELAEGLRAALGAAVVTVCAVGRDGLVHVQHVAGHSSGTAADFAPMPLAAPLPLTDAVRTGRPVWLPDRAAWEERYPEVVPDVRGQTEAAAVLPLAVGERVVGAVGVAFRTAHAFEPAERTFLLSLAGQAALAYERAALADTRQEIAETLQHSLLPRNLPDLERLAVTARYLPGQRGTQAGGDWYDVLPLDDGRVAVAVGDVVGNGAAAAAVMGQLRSALATLLLEGHPPARALALLDRFAARVEGARVSTAACLLLDPATGRLVYSRAGHPPPLVLDAAGARYLDEARGPALDLPTATERVDAETVLTPGATLLLYTDGLVERRRETLDDGLDRLAAVAGELAGSAPAELVDRLLARLLEDAGPLDDIAVVAARLVPATLRAQLRADPAELRGLRRRVHEWADGAGVSEETADDLLLVMGEAVANAVEHAYPARDGTGRVHVTLSRDGDVLAGSVRDEGTWRPPPADPGYRGRGLQIIRSLAEGVRVTPGPGGTTVRFRIRLPAAAQAGPAPGGGAAEGWTAERRTAEVAVVGEGSGRCVRLTGDLDLAGATAVRAALLAAVGPGAVLDLTGLDSISSVGMGLVVEAVEAAGGAGAVEVLLPGSGATRRALELAGLTALLRP